MFPIDHYDYSGVIHTHSIYSDGARTVPEIVQAAAGAGCSYLILTDHDTLKGYSREGVYGTTLLLVGEEITVGDEEGHYLAVRLNSEVQPHNSPQNTINEVKIQGGLGFPAHPFNRTTNHQFNLTPVRWKDWNVTGITGIELWNYSHDWAENFTWYNSLAGWLYPDVFIEGPVPETIQKWDELSQKERITAIGSVDAHGLFYPYSRIFKTLHTHLLLKEPLSFQEFSFSRDKKLIYRALERGHCYLGNDYLSDSGGFIFSVSNKEQQAIMGIMGDIINIQKDLCLQVRPPGPGLIKLLRNGQLIASAEDAALLIKDIPGPGVYRAEVYLEAYKGLKKCCRPWIFSNPVYLV